MHTAKVTALCTQPLSISSPFLSIARQTRKHKRNRHARWHNLYCHLYQLYLTIELFDTAVEIPAPNRKNQKYFYFHSYYTLKISAKIKASSKLKIKE
jgi:hypothetical protein